MYCTQPSYTVNTMFVLNHYFSAGIGRTGVLITMETALTLLDKGQPVFPLDIVKTLRDQRAMMVQTTVRRNNTWIHARVGLMINLFSLIQFLVCREQDKLSFYRRSWEKSFFLAWCVMFVEKYYLKTQINRRVKGRRRFLVGVRGFFMFYFVLYFLT